MVACDFAEHGNVASDDWLAFARRLDDRQSEAFSFGGGDERVRARIDRLQLPVVGLVEPEQPAPELRVVRQAIHQQRLEPTGPSQDDEVDVRPPRPQPATPIVFSLPPFSGSWRW